MAGTKYTFEIPEDQLRQPRGNSLPVEESKDSRDSVSLSIRPASVDQKQPYIEQLLHSQRRESHKKVLGTKTQVEQSPEQTSHDFSLIKAGIKQEAFPKFQPVRLRPREEVNAPRMMKV